MYMDVQYMYIQVMYIVPVYLHYFLENSFLDFIHIVGTGVI